MTIMGQEVKVPSKAAVVEHFVTLPMFLAAIAAACGWVASAAFFGPTSPWQKLLLSIATGMPLLSTQLGQIWHSRNIRQKVATANLNAVANVDEQTGRLLPHPNAMTLEADELAALARYRAERDAAKPGKQEAPL